MENKKLTNSKALEMVMAIVQEKYTMADFTNEDKKDLYCKLVTMKEQVDKKSNSGKTGKPTKVQEENMKIMENLELVLMESAEPLQIKEIQALEGFTDFTNQKLSALMKKLVDTGKVEKVVEKRISKFKIKE